MVVTRCDRTAAYAANRGAVALQEHSTAGLNGALHQAFAVVAAIGATKMLVVAADLPLVSVEDLLSLAGAASPTLISVAPDRHQTGTNGLCLPTDRPFAFSFGVDSLPRHLSQIQSIQMNSAVVRRPGLALDLDGQSDLKNLLEGSSPSRCHLSFLRALCTAAGDCRHFEA
jgi:2-phospho-L-lactate/phosphoenolpyruvate guanylyltransferase